MVKPKYDITMDYVLKSKNAEGRMYVCDIWRLLQGKVSLKMATEIRNAFEKAIEK